MASNERPGIRVLGSLRSAAGAERCDAEARFEELLPVYQDLAADIGAL